MSNTPLSSKDQSRLPAVPDTWFSLRPTRLPTSTISAKLANLNPRGSYSISPRSGHSACAAANGDIYLFGGLVKGHLSNDLYRYSTKNNTVCLVQSHGDIPTPRRYHAGALIGDVLVIMGGNTEKKYYDDSLYVLHLSSREWTKITTHGQCPGPRIHHGGTAIGSTFFIFGGSKGVSVLNDLWALDLRNVHNKPTWKLVEPSSAVRPASREEMTFIPYQDLALILIGGHGPNSTLSDAWSFDLETGNWMEFQCTGQIPNLRFGREAAIVDDVIYSLCPPEGKLIGFKITTQQWLRPVIVGPNPCTRKDHAMASVATRVFLFGGTSSSKDFDPEIIFSFDARDIDEPNPHALEAGLQEDFARQVKERDAEIEAMKYKLRKAQADLRKTKDELEKTKEELIDTGAKLARVEGNMKAAVERLGESDDRWMEAEEKLDEMRRKLIEAEAKLTEGEKKKTSWKLW